jgi:hypothetical protein
MRDVLVSLRRLYGERAPSYMRLWSAIQDGRVAARREPSCLMVEDDDATIAAALGLTAAEPSPVQRPKPRPRPSSPSLPPAA